MGVERFGILGIQDATMMGPTYAARERQWLLPNARLDQKKILDLTLQCQENLGRRCQYYIMETYIPPKQVQSYLRRL